MKDLLSNFSSSLAERNHEQKVNISIGVNYINNKTIRPNDIFSFNKIVGPRNIDKGFLDARAFMEGELITSIGGGICQLSSTLYAASLMAGLKIIKRVPHFYTVDSVPPGLDASVWYAKSDLIVQNPFSYPVKIRAFIVNNILKVEIWGTKHEKCKISFIDKKIIQPKIKIIYTNSLKTGKRLITEGRKGCYIKTIRKCAYSISEELISEDVYKAFPTTIMIGR